jgi:hypothetical protein
MSGSEKEKTEVSLHAIITTDIKKLVPGISDNFVRLILDQKNPKQKATAIEKEIQRLSWGRDREEVIKAIESDNGNRLYVVRGTEDFSSLISFIKKNPSDFPELSDILGFISFRAEQFNADYERRQSGFPARSLTVERKKGTGGEEDPYGRLQAERSNRRGELTQALDNLNGKFESFNKDSPHEKEDNFNVRITAQLLGWTTPAKDKKKNSDDNKK